MAAPLRVCEDNEISGSMVGLLCCLVELIQAPREGLGRLPLRV